MSEATNTNVDSVDDFDDASVKVHTFAKYGGIAGQTDRLAIITKKGNIVRAFVHFYNGKGFVCLTPKGGADAICCERCGPPDMKFGVVVFQYATNGQGELVSEDSCQGTPKLWIFSDKKWVDLKAIGVEFPLLDSGADAEQVDIKINCEDTKWQKMKMTCTRNAHYKTNPAWHATISALCDKAHIKLQQTIGKARTLDEVREILGVQVQLAQDGGNAPSEEVDLSDVMEAG